jgi:hypothetical protein
MDLILLIIIFLLCECRFVRVCARKCVYVCTLVRTEVALFSFCRRPPRRCVCACVCSTCVCVIMYLRLGDWIITQLPLQLLFRDVEYLMSLLLEVDLLFLQSDMYNKQT